MHWCVCGVCVCVWCVCVCVFRLQCENHHQRQQLCDTQQLLQSVRVEVQVHGRWRTPHTHTGASTPHHTRDAWTCCRGRFETPLNIWCVQVRAVASGSESGFSSGSERAVGWDKTSCVFSWREGIQINPTLRTETGTTPCWPAPTPRSTININYCCPKRGTHTLSVFPRCS